MNARNASDRDKNYMLCGIVKLAVVALVAAALLGSTGCAKKVVREPVPQAVSIVAAEETAPLVTENDKQVYLSEEPESDWVVFQETYKLALLDQKNGGTVFDRAEWEGYWYAAPEYFDSEGLTQEASQAAKMALEILEAGGDPEVATPQQLSDLQLYAENAK